MQTNKQDEQYIIIDDPLEWYKVPLEVRAEALKKYHQDNYKEYKQNPYQTSLI